MIHRSIRISVLLLCMAMASTVARTRLQAFEGFAALFNVDRVTVVYPAEADGNPAVPRLSAERAAAFLQSKHGVISEVVSDAAVTREQREGHLLLLGWNNLLLGTGKAPVPFIRRPDGYRLLGSIPIDTDKDLLFIHRSPYNSEKYLAFWSRMDPELDRFNVLPFHGSDWGVFLGYYATHLGMFEDRAEWPPRLKTDGSMSLPYRPSPVRRESEHYALHYPAGLLRAEEVDRIVDARERAYRAAAQAVGDPGPGFRIDLHLFVDNKTKTNESGVPDSVHSVPRRRELFMMFQHAVAADPHEEIHILAHAAMGPCYHTALYEGLAIVRGRSTAAELDAFVGLLVETGRLPTVGDLLDEERLRKLVESRAGFPASGLLIAWIQETAGPAALRHIYTMMGATPAALAGPLELSPDGVEPAFRAWAEAKAEGAAGELAFRKALAEAQASYAKADDAGVARALARGLEARPGDPRTLYRLGFALIRTEEYKLAGRRFQQLLDLEPDDQNLRYQVFAHYQLGKLEDLRGRRKQALERYRQVLALPDVQNSHRMAREAIDNPPDEAGSDEKSP